MYLFILAIYLILYVIIFLKISKKNGSYFNSWTVSMGYDFLLQGVFFFMYAFSGEPQTLYSEKVLNIFAISLVISIVSRYIGYSLGYRNPVKFKVLMLPVQKKETNLFIVSSVFLAFVSFLLLALNGVGVYEWIFNSREAYIVGRAGNGMYYILFMFFLSVALVTIFYKWARFKKGHIFTFLLLLVFCYLTGSKAFLLGIILSLLFFIDAFRKRFKLGPILVIGTLAIIVANLLLVVQSHTTIFAYVKGDFYFNYLNEITAIENGELSYFYGKIWFEDRVFSWLPRNIFPFKPLIYGASRLPAFFYGEASVIAGNTPSFGSLGYAYADFGLFGVVIFAVIPAFITGLLESSLRKAIRENKHRYAPYIFYSMLFFITMPVIFWVVCLLLFFYLKFIKTLCGNSAGTGMIQGLNNS